MDSLISASDLSPPGYPVAGSRVRICSCPGISVLTLSTNNSISRHVCLTQAQPAVDLLTPTEPACREQLHFVLEW
jgi:hypothetical protein